MTCPYCGKTFDQGDATVRIETGRVSHKNEGSRIIYHSGCFMDIVNSEENLLKMTDIAEGNVKKGEENGIELD